MEKMLRDKEVYPDEKVLGNTLKNNYIVYEQLMDAIRSPELELSTVWNYYNDGKNWLCKVFHKKKTIFWLSVWDGFFKTSFFFTEKTSEGIASLDIKEIIKKEFFESKPIGRLIPLVIDVNKDNLEDVLKIAMYKKKLK